MNYGNPTIHVLSGTVALDKIATASTGHVTMNADLQFHLFKRLAEIHDALGTNENWFSTGIAAEVFHGTNISPPTLLETAVFDICVNKADFPAVILRLNKSARFEFQEPPDALEFILFRTHAVFHKRGTQNLYLTVYTHDTYGYEIRTVKESAHGLYSFPLLDDYMEALAKKCIETPQLANIPDMPPKLITDVSRHWEQEFNGFCDVMAGRVNHKLSSIDISFKVQIETCAKLCLKFISICETIIQARTKGLNMVSSYHELAALNVAYNWANFLSLLVRKMLVPGQTSELIKSWFASFNKSNEMATIINFYVRARATIPTIPSVV